MRKICNFIIKFSIYALVFLTPLFWLPWSAEIFEFNKQYLIFVLIGLALLSWLAKMVFVQRKITFYRTSLDLWILIFAIVMILSAVFSVDKVSSWLGFYGRFSDSVAVLLAVLVGYFVVVNNVETVKNPSETEETEDAGTGLIHRESKLNKETERKWGVSLKMIFGLILSSASLVIIAAYLSIFNLWAKIPGLPPAMSFRSFNPTGGSLEALSVFLVAMLGLAVGMFLQRIKVIGGNKFLNFIYLSFCVLAVFLLALINFPAAWLVLGVTMFVLLALALWTRMFKEQVNLLALPIILILISAFYWFGLPAKISPLNGLTFYRLQPPREVILDYPTTIKVAWESLRTYPVLGSGPGTFANDFSKLKPVAFNASNFWNVRFDKAASQLAEMAGTTGVLGILSYLMLLVVFTLIVFVFFSRKKMEALGLKSGGAEAHYSKFGLPLALAWFTLFLSQFFYYQNTGLIFYFWLFMALLMVVWQSIQSKPVKRINFSFKKIPEIGLIFNVFVLVLVFVLFGLFYLAGRFYLAEIKLSRPAETNEKVISVFEQAVNLNAYRENYRAGLAQAYLITAWAEANKPEAERNVNLIQALAAGSIQQAREATLISQNSVRAWENLGAIYRDSSGLVSGAMPFAVEAFDRAKDLEPSNPVFYREICRLRLLDEEANLDETLEYCQRAVDLKPNYLDANIQLALVYEKKGQLEEAVKQMESLLEQLKGVSFQRGSDLAGAVTEIYFQLGRLQFNLNDMDKAISTFEQAVIITPGYANARYALALSYASQGRKEDALTQLEIVDQLAPNNENVQALIEQLSSLNNQ